MSISCTLFAGFQKISGKDFRSDPLKDGKQLIDPKSQHVFDVKETFYVDRDVSTISAKCAKSMKYKETPYSVLFDIKRDRTVVLAHCSCVSGADGECKHSAALYQYVNSERCESKTSQTQEFQKPSKVLCQLYPKGESIQELYPRCNKFEHDYRPPADEELKDLSSLMQQFGLQNRSLFKSINCKKNSAQKLRAHNPKFVEPRIAAMLMETLVPNMFGINHLEKLMDKKSEEEKTFFESNVLLDLSNAVKIFHSTVEQAKSPEWFLYRKYRVTASIAHRISRGRKPETRLKYFSDDLMTNKNLQYGKAMEPVALEKYLQLTKRSVLPSGLIISPTLPWLACTPDGIVVEEESGEMFPLEIKCPISCTNSKIVVDYIINDKLKRSHPYYFQCQLQIFLCRAKKGHFFVYSSADHLLITVERDDDFL